MSINKLLDALEQTIDAGANKSVIFQLLAHRDNFSRLVFIRAINTHQELIERYLQLLSKEQRIHVKPIFDALLTFSLHFSEPSYKEHLLQKYVVENNIVGVQVGIDLGVNVNTTVDYVEDLACSKLKKGFQQILSFSLPTAWVDSWYHATPLVLASMLGHKDIVKLLVKNGARLDCETKHHNTALDWATKRSHYKIEHFLMQCNAPRNTTSEGGELDALAAWIKTSM